MDASWGQHLDAELFMGIQAELDDIKLGVAEVWMGGELLAGGYGRAIKHWQRDPQSLAIFKHHAAMVKSNAESVPFLAITTMRKKTLCCQAITSPSSIRWPYPCRWLTS